MIDDFYQDLELVWSINPPKELKEKYEKIEKPFRVEKVLTKEDLRGTFNTDDLVGKKVSILNKKYLEPQNSEDGLIQLKRIDAGKYFEYLKYCFKHKFKNLDSQKKAAIEFIKEIDESIRKAEYLGINKAFEITVKGGYRVPKNIELELEIIRLKYDFYKETIVCLTTCCRLAQPSDGVNTIGR